MKYIITLLAAVFMVGSAFANETSAGAAAAETQPAAVKKAKKAAKAPHGKKKAKKEKEEAPADMAHGDKEVDHKAE